MGFGKIFFAYFCYVICIFKPNLSTMKKVFTLVLAMTIVVASFAQIKSVSHKAYKPQAAQKVTYTGFEERDYAGFPFQQKSIVLTPQEEELSFTAYDWQSNMGARNYTAVWPDGYAVMCYTQSPDETFADRGTGLSIWDPAVGEWEFTDAPVEAVRTGFGSIARYKENGLVVAAHTNNDLRIFIVEDFREGNRDFGNGIVCPVETGLDPAWPVVQCSGENLDIINVLCTNNGGTTPYTDPILYYQYVNGEWTHQYEIIPNLDADHMTDGGSNICYFMHYNPAKPNRVAFIVNNAWSDGKCVISEDNGSTWSERVFYQHPNINGDFTDTWFFYPRWTSAEFDDNDNLCLVYEWNGTTETAGSGSYYPSVGGVGYWSEVLPKSELCLGGIGEVGQPFIMDSTYMMQDIYQSEWYWSDANHDPVPEYFGMLQILDENKEVWPWWNEDMPDTYYWLDLENRGEHGKYNNGITGFASMHMDGNRVFAFWSMVCGDSETIYFDGTNHNFRLFAALSTDGGRTWECPQQVTTDVMSQYNEYVYGQVIPYVYSDAQGEYLWYLYQCDGQTGTYVQSDESEPGDNYYKAVKFYIKDYWGVEENGDVVAPAVTMNVFPNPANGAFTFELNNEADVNIFNAVGQLVKTYKSVKSVVVNDLEAGIYFVKAGNQTQKVVVF